MRKLTALILAAALLILVIPGASAASGYEGVWVHVSISETIGSVFLNTLSLLPSGTAFLCVEMIASGSGTRLVTEYTWAEIDGGIRLTKVTDMRTCDYLLDGPGVLVFDGYEGTVYHQIDPAIYD